MNKYLRIAGILSVLCFSFYFTEQAALFMRSQDPLYESIVAVKEEYKEESINAPRWTTCWNSSSCPA